MTIDVSRFAKKSQLLFTRNLHQVERSLFNESRFFSWKRIAVKKMRVLDSAAYWARFERNCSPKRCAAQLPLSCKGFRQFCPFESGIRAALPRRDCPRSKLRCRKASIFCWDGQETKMWKLQRLFISLWLLIWRYHSTNLLKTQCQWFRLFLSKFQW